ncbi:hypothetical protein T439DRAFT_360143 [Meredithblackwellia eburnea MCA 4105]
MYPTTSDSDSSRESLLEKSPSGTPQQLQKPNFPNASLPPSRAPVPVRPTTIWRQKHPKKASFANELRHSDASSGRIQEDLPLPPHPNFLTRLFLLVFLSIRPRRLRHQLQTEDPVKVWTAMRVRTAFTCPYSNSLVKRWGSLTVLSGLMIAYVAVLMLPKISFASSDRVPCRAGATMSAPARDLATDQHDLSLVEQLPYALGIAARCSAVIAAAFGTGLSLVFQDANPRDFVRLAQSPIHLVIVLGAPAFFAISAITFFYVSMIATAWIDSTWPSQVITTAGASWVAVLIVYCVYLVYKVSDPESDADRQGYLF